jgi:hypothetical protein
MQTPPPKPKSYSQNEVDLFTIKQENYYLRQSVDELSSEMKAHSTEIHNLTVIIQSLSVKVADLSDLYLKIGIPTIITMIGTVVVHYLWK